MFDSQTFQWFRLIWLSRLYVHLKQCVSLKKTWIFGRMSIAQITPHLPRISRLPQTPAVTRMLAGASNCASRLRSLMEQVNRYRQTSQLVPRNIAEASRQAISDAETWKASTKRMTSPDIPARFTPECSRLGSEPMTSFMWDAFNSESSEGSSESHFSTRSTRIPNSFGIQSSAAMRLKQKLRRTQRALNTRRKHRSPVKV